MAVNGVSGTHGNPPQKPNEPIDVADKLKRAVSPTSLDGYTSGESPDYTSSEESSVNSRLDAASPSDLSRTYSSDGERMSPNSLSEVKQLTPSHKTTQAPNFSLTIDTSMGFGSNSTTTSEQLLTPTNTFEKAIRDKSLNKQFYSSIPLEDGSTLVLLNHLSRDGEQIDLFGRGAEGKVRPGLLIHTDGTEEYVAIKKEHLNLESNMSKLAEGKVNLVQSIPQNHVLPIYKGIVSKSKKEYATLYTASPIMKSSLSKQEDIKALIIPKHIESIRELLTGLRDIHSQNILHRDLSVDNIFIDHTGKIMIGDFGVAKQLDGPDGKLYYHGKEKIQQQFFNCDLERQPPVSRWSEANFSKKSEVFTIGFSIYESIFLFQNGVNEGAKPFTNLKKYHEEVKVICEESPSDYDSYIKSLKNYTPEKQTDLTLEQFEILQARLADLRGENSEELLNLLNFMENFFKPHDERPDADTLLQQYNKLFPIKEASTELSQTTPDPKFEPAKKDKAAEEDISAEVMLENSKLIAKFANETSQSLNEEYANLDPQEQKSFVQKFTDYASLMINSQNIDLIEQLNTEDLNNELKAPLEKILSSTQSTYSDQLSEQTSQASSPSYGYESDGYESGDLSDYE